MSKRLRIFCAAIAAFVIMAAPAYAPDDARESGRSGAPTVTGP